MALTPDSPRGSGFRWLYVAGAILLAGAATGIFFALSPSPVARAGFAGTPPSVTPSVVPRRHGLGTSSSGAPTAKATATATASRQDAQPAVSGVYAGGAVPRGGANFAGSLLLSETGAQLAAWNQTSSQCSEQSWEIPNGTVTTDASGDADLSVSGESGSCVALVSPQAYSSAVIEAELDFPALPGSPDTIADWTSFWLTNGPKWPTDGELDAVEVEPVDGVNDVTWHSGSAKDEFSASTADFFNTELPQDAPDLTPGWHTVDIVYTKGFFAVYYDGEEYTSYTSGNVTGDPLNIYLTTSVAANDATVRGELGGPPVNSDSSPATIAVKYLKVWSFR